MANPTLLMSRGGRLLLSSSRRAMSTAGSVISNSFSSSSPSYSSQFDWVGQAYTCIYEPGQPTQGPLGQAQREPRITPKRLKEHLDKFVVGQERAKRMLSVAVYNQYQRIQELQRQEDLERERFAQIARRTMAYEKYGKHPVEGEYLPARTASRYMLMLLNR